MSEQIVLQKGNHHFYDDSQGRYYYKDYENYLRGNKTYLIKCSRCEDYIYMKDHIFVDKSSRESQPIIHERCR